MSCTSVFCEGLDVLREARALRRLVVSHKMWYEGIINAYEAKTKMSRAQISQLIDAESCFNAKKAIELGFADGVLYSESQPIADTAPVMFYRAAVTNSMVNRLQQRSGGVLVEGLRRRLAAI